MNLPFNPGRTPQQAPRQRSTFDEEVVQRLGRLKQDHQALRDLRIRKEADLKRAREELAKAQDEAVAAYGTDDVAQIRDRVREAKAAVQDELDAFDASITGVREGLASLAASLQQDGQA